MGWKPPPFPSLPTPVRPALPPSRRLANGPAGRQSAVPARRPPYRRRVPGREERSRSGSGSAAQARSQAAGGGPQHHRHPRRPGGSGTTSRTPPPQRPEGHALSPTHSPPPSPKSVAPTPRPHHCGARDNPPALPAAAARSRGPFPPTASRAPSGGWGADRIWRAAAARRGSGVPTGTGGFSPRPRSPGLPPRGGSTRRRSFRRTPKGVFSGAEGDL